MALLLYNTPGKRSQTGHASENRRDMRRKLRDHKALIARHQDAHSRAQEEGRTAEGRLPELKQNLAQADKEAQEAQKEAQHHADGVLLPPPPSLLSGRRSHRADVDPFWHPHPHPICAAQAEAFSRACLWLTRSRMTARRQLCMDARRSPASGIYGSSGQETMKRLCHMSQHFGPH